jgi:hypothetical protein
MKRAFLTVAATALLVAPSALGATPATGVKTIAGTVVGKDRSHHALVVASKAGAVRMIEAPGAFQKTDVGRRVVVRYRLSAAGLPVSLGVRRGSEAGTATVRGTVIRVHRGQVLLSAGGSALRVSLATVKRQRVLSSVGAGPKPGDAVEIEVDIDDDGSLDATGVSVTSAGAAGAQSTSEGELEVRGTVLAVSPDVVVKTGTGVVVTCVVPAGSTPAGIAVGDLVELKCDLIGGKWMLRKAHGEDEDEGTQEEHHSSSSELEVRGTLTSLDPLTVTSASGEAVTCAIPAGVTLTGFVQGQLVELKCRTIDGVPTLERLKIEGSGDDHGDDGPDSSEDSGSSGSGDDD